MRDFVKLQALALAQNAFAIAVTIPHGAELALRTVAIFNLAAACVLAVAEAFRKTEK
jgi:hypothetical protein